MFWVLTISQSHVVIVNETDDSILDTLLKKLCETRSTDQWLAHTISYYACVLLLLEHWQYKQFVNPAIYMCVELYDQIFIVFSA